MQDAVAITSHAAALLYVSNARRGIRQLPDASISEWLEAAVGSFDTREYPDLCEKYHAMKTCSILAVCALAVLTVSSCISFDDHDDRPPVTTTTVTQETNRPMPYTDPALTQTTETRTTRTVR
ncbi:MAG: hypothetical protein JWR15_490 [Prosthecobacter sp.]|nr:hypothetical protein [Prosthecobacter sp.]